MRTRVSVVTALAVSLLTTATAHAAGFQVNHFEPTTAGEYGFMVDRPYYSSTRYFAVGITMDYAHAPIVNGRRDADGVVGNGGPIVEHALYGHFDLAFSLIDRFTFSGSVPVLLYDEGTPASGIAAAREVVVGDPRVGVMMRVIGHADRDPFSMHLGTSVWLPLDNTQLTGDDEARAMPKVVFTGYARHLQWSFTGGYYFRKEDVIGSEPPAPSNSSGPEVQLGLAIAYADFENRFSVGPEALFSTIVSGGRAFDLDYASLQTLMAVNVNILREVQFGLAGGVGFFQQAGNPDARGLLRIAYAPIRKSEREPPRRIDTDGDFVFDDVDRCPNAKEDVDGFLDNDGCPEDDNDGDGLLDGDDRCPREAGPRENTGCPDSDRDLDGLVDRVDPCADDAEDLDGFEDGDGCPESDNDKDGVPDGIDKCPSQPGPRALDGCPEPDRDGDTVIDRLDNCPDELGTAANQGCARRQLAKIADGRIEIAQSVSFANGTATISKVSLPLLSDVAAILNAHEELDVRVEGHTDNVGKEAANQTLSQRRADAVKAYLVKKGVPVARVTAEGFGSSRPIDTNKTKLGRANNRRVVFATTTRGTAVKAEGSQ